jgi:hypothetical protein
LHSDGVGLAPSAAGRDPVDPLLGFLWRSPFRGESPSPEAWICLDFLGFSRQNRDFSMGYADFSPNQFSRALPWREKPGAGALGLAHAEGGIGHRIKLSLTSDFPQ